MTIWIDDNGWPIPPAVLLVCLVAEILYFRGWQILVKAEQEQWESARAASATTSSVSTGSHTGRYHWDSPWQWRSIYFLIAIMVALVGD